MNFKEGGSTKGGMGKPRASKWSDEMPITKTYPSIMALYTDPPIMQCSLRFMVASIIVLISCMIGFPRLNKVEEVAGIAKGGG
ncbi:unnamed protein product [Prunus armeniaca]|uniref:Uncharacterized protein n=1 Tax=Prunus armeniaca TaxID=36596 RepID=A0A6J5VMK4_PRUAR|nr:unnamed protein product [Prunus armeniaca]CAB4319756.1 unnamed protein product [Prunus armeniaca]